MTLVVSNFVLYKEKNIGWRFYRPNVYHTIFSKKKSLLYYPHQFSLFV
jgi:hypothetical protein